MLRKNFIPGEERVHDLSDDDLPAAPKKILIVDNDPDLSGILRDFLETEGYRVAIANDGVEGVKLVMADTFDIILCDMIMPNMRGDMFYKAVERTKAHLCQRFIFMTGHSADKEIGDFIRSIRGLALWKPFEMHQLTEAIGVVLKKVGSSHA